MAVEDSRVPSTIVRRSKSLCVVLAAFAAGGCFRYVPVQVTAVPPQEEVRLHVTDDAAIRLARDFGRITPELDARLEPHGPDSLMVSVWIGRNYPGTQFENVHQTVSLGRSELVQVRRRQFSWQRTALATAGTLAIFAVLVGRIFQQEDPNTPREDGPNPPPPDPGFIRIPIGFGFGGIR
jgi:hypothetical protein